MDKTLQDIMKENGDGNFFTDVGVTPGQSTTNLPLNVRGTDTGINEVESQGFFTDLSDYYKSVGGNQTAQGIVDTFVKPFQYPSEEGYEVFKDPNYESQDPEFKKRFASALAGSKSPKETLDKLLQYQEQERIEERLFDPKYDANNLAAVSGAIFGGVFDVTNAVPLRAVYSAKKLTQAYKLAALGKRGADKANVFTKHARLFEALSTSSQFAAAESVREIVGSSSWERSSDEILLNVGAAALLGAGIHTLVSSGAAKSLGTMQAKTIMSSTDEIVEDAFKISFTPGEKLSTPEGFRGHLLTGWNKIVSAIKPNVSMATSSNRAVRESIFKLDGTAYDTVDGGLDAPIYQQLQVDVAIKNKAYQSYLNEEYYGAYALKGGTLTQKQFAREINNVSAANKGKTIEEFVSSGIEEVDNFYKNVKRVEDTKTMKMLQDQGEFLGVDLKKGYHHEMLDEGVLIAKPADSKAAIAKAMKSADEKALKKFLDMETQLKVLGLKLNRSGRLTKKALEAFKKANDGNESATKLLEEYLNTAKKATTENIEELDFRKAAPRVRDDYTSPAEELYNKVISGDDGAYVPVRSSGNIKKSTGRLDWDFLREFAVNDYDNHTVRASKSLIRRARMIEYFGDATGNKQRKLINDVAAEDLAEAQKITDTIKREEAVAKVLKDRDDGLANFEGVLNRFFDKKSTGQRAHGWLDLTIKGMKALVSIPLLAKGVISQVGDLVQYFSHQMVINWKRIGNNVPSITNKTELGFDSSTAKRFGIESESGFDSRAKAMHGDNLDSNSGYTPGAMRNIAEFFDWLSEQTFKFNGMTLMNNVVRNKSAGDMLESVVNLAKLANEGKLAKNAEYQGLIKDLNLNEAKLKAIWKEYSKNPNINTWNENISSRLMAKIRQYNNNKIVIEPSIGDKPFAFDQQAAQPFALFKGFLIASMDKFLGRDIQEGVRGGNRMIARVIVGTMLYIAKSSMTQNGTNWDPKALVLEGIYQSGNFPLMDLGAQLLDQAFDFGPERLFGIEGVGRKYFKGNNTLLETAVGPINKIFKDVEKLTKKAATGKLTTRDILTLSQYHYALAPFYVQYPLKQLMEKYN